MIMQDKEKLIVLLIALVALVNYTNYFQKDISKSTKEIALLEQKIAFEEYVSHSGFNEQNLSNELGEIFYDGAKMGYSEAMGAFQNTINEAAKNNCTVERINWAQVPTTKEWYDKLRMGIVLSCSPDELAHFYNNLKADPKLFIFENLSITKVQRADKIRVTGNLLGFRSQK